MPTVSEVNERDRRVLLFAPTRRDAEVTGAILSRAGIHCERCGDFSALRREIEGGAGTVLTTWEAVADADRREFLAALHGQPSWSDLGVVLLIKSGDQPPAARQFIAALTNVTLLERPASTRSVVSTVQAAIRARLRQYQIRDQITALERERTRSEQLQEELSLAVNASELGTFHCPLPPDKIYWNTRCKALFWLPPDAEVDFDRFYSILHPADREPTRQAVEACVRGDQPYRVTYRTVSPGGQIRHVLAIGRIYHDAEGQPTRFDGTAQDVTEQRLAEETLRHSESRFRELADAMPQIVWTATPDGELGYSNRRGYEYVGRIPETASPAHWGAFVHADDLPGAVETWGACLASGERYSTEFRLRNKEGSYRWFLVRALPIRGAEGGIVQWYGTCTDIHDQRAILEQNARLLESERGARTEAERASRMKDEFLATLSHELRTPLNAILGWTHVLNENPADVAGVAEGLAVIERNARAQNQIIEDLLDMSRIISGKVRLDVQRAELAPIVEAAVETVRPAAAARGIRLQVTLDPAARPVSGDPSRLQQVFWNLLTNAIKFTPKEGRVQVILARINSHLEVSVTDTGKGIAADFLPYAFDRFRQADSSTSRQHGGLGLGLAIVKQLVELHGGTVRVASGGTDAGSTFTVALPLTVLRPEAPPDEPESRHPGPKGLEALPVPPHLRLEGVRIMVVDDEADARELVRRLLEARGASVITQGSAAEALAGLRSAQFDVLVSDIGMPGEDGYSLIRKVRSLGPAAGGAVPAVALTAYARAEDRMKAVLAGFQMHLTKPVEPAELLTMVASLAGRTG